MLISASNVPDYQIKEQIHAGSQTLVFRVRRESNSQAVVIKLLHQEYLTFQKLVQFRNQYTITRNLNIISIFS
jgi:serine/threonine protein kinase